MTLPSMIKVASPQVGRQEIAAVEEVLLSGQYVSGRKVGEFETLFSEYVGVDHSVAVNSGTAALHSALDVLGVGPGDEVIVPALTFFSTVTAVVHQAGVPIFCDISLDNFCLDPDDLLRRITPRTKAIIAVHYFGHAAEMDAINQIAKRYGLAVIEDCAQAHGTTYKGRKVGSIGDMGAYSFFATKHMTTGEGGIVTTNDVKANEKMRSFRSHGMEGRHDHVMLGYNYRMTEIAAAIGIIQLDKLDELNEKRIKASEYLIEQLSGVSWLTMPKVPSYVRHTYFWCHAMINEDLVGQSTQSVIQTLRNKGVEVRERYTEPLYRQPMLTHFIPPILQLSGGANLPAYGDLNLPNVEQAAGRIIGLPNRPDITQAELDKVVESVLSIG